MVISTDSVLFDGLDLDRRNWISLVLTCSRGSQKPIVWPLILDHVSYLVIVVDLLPDFCLGVLLVTCHTRDMLGMFVEEMYELLRWH